MKQRGFGRLGAATVAAALLVAAAARAEAPRAVVGNTVVDVGVVSKGKPITHDFVIVNEGSAELEITEVKPACGCTVASYASRIQPGRSGKISVVLETREFSGPIAKSVTVFTNDPANPQLLLVVKANIRPEIEVSPGFARFVVVQGEGYEPSEHRLRASGDRPFRIVGVESPVPFVKAGFAPLEGSGSEWSLELRLEPGAPIGPIADFVVVTTDHPEQQKVKIPVSGFVRPPLVVVPQVFDFGRRKLEEPYPGKVQVRVVSSGPVQLGEVSSDLEGVEAEVEEVDAGKLYNLVIRLQPGMKTGPTEGTLTVQTDSERYPVLQIPVRGTVLGSG